MTARPPRRAPFRVCDRCFRHKTQCDFDDHDSCARCNRLGVNCVTERAVRQRGRPPKGSSSARETGGPQRRTTTSNIGSSASPGDVHEPVHVTGLPQSALGSKLDAAVTTRLIESFLSRTGRLGPYHLLQDHHSFADSRTTSCKAFVCGILAIALELSPGLLPASDAGQTDLAKWALLDDCLSQIQPSTRDYQPTIHNALILTLISSAWCLSSSDLIRSSGRWNSLAKTIITELQSIAKWPSDISRQHETTVAVHLQERVIALLGYTAEPFAHPSVSTEPAMLLPINTSKMLPETYFGLFEPFIHILDLVLQEPELNTRAWTEAFEDLELYFLRFPSSLLRFCDLQFQYQAEAMISMHGLFIMLYTKRDLLNILLEPAVLGEDVLAHALGHSLLLGEVLPRFDELDRQFEGIGSLTVFSILVSCIVQVAILTRLSAGDGSAPSVFAVPETLSRSSLAHLRTLAAIRARCRRFDVPLLLEVQRLLETCHHHVILGYDNGVAMSASVLMLYRWKGHGMGVLPLTEDAAKGMWEYSCPSVVDIRSSVSSSGVSRSLQVIQEVCSPDSRLCEPGFFDMSIVIR